MAPGAARRSRSGRRASAFSACSIVSCKGVRFVALSARSYFSSCTRSIPGPLRTALRDRLAVCEISRTVLRWRKCVRRIVKIIVVVTDSIGPATAA